MRRGGPPRRPRPASAQRLELLVFAEGLRTEELYLVHWQRLYRDRVIVTIDPFRGGPLQLVQHAVAARRREAQEARRGRGRAHDQVWCVFDIDEHPHVAEAIELAGHHGIGLAISNPCLELWFVLHFEEHTAYIHRDDAQRRAASLLNCRKVLSKSAFDALVDRYATAADRARRLDGKHRGDGSPPGSNPSTGIWRLVDLIRSAGHN